jgi:hypothetical protein
MTQLEIEATIAEERALLLSHQERLTNSKYLRGVCQRGLNDLEDAERFSRNPEPNWGIVQIALRLAIEERKTIEDAVNKYGYTVFVAPEDL